MNDYIFIEANCPYCLTKWEDNKYEVSNVATLAHHFVVYCDECCDPFVVQVKILPIVTPLKIESYPQPRPIKSDREI